MGIAGSQSANLVVNIVTGNPECTVQQSSSNLILQYGVSYSKSFASMAKGQLLAAQYQGEDVKCCWVEKATIDKMSLTPCDSVAAAPTTTAPTTTTPVPTTTTPAPTTTTPAPTTTTPKPYYSCPKPYYSCPAGF